MNGKHEVGNPSEIMELNRFDFHGGLRLEGQPDTFVGDEAGTLAVSKIRVKE